MLYLYLYIYRYIFIHSYSFSFLFVSIKSLLQTNAYSKEQGTQKLKELHSLCPTVRLFFYFGPQIPLPLVEELSNPLVELVVVVVVTLSLPVKVLLVFPPPPPPPPPPNPKAFNLLEILLPSTILLLKSSILVVVVVILGNVCDNDVKLDVK